MPRPVLPAIAVLLLAAACLAYGIVQPVLNYDAIPYATLAKHWRGAGGKAEAYAEMAATVGDSRFQLYIGDPYRQRMYRDDDYFRLNMPLYTIRPLYILACAGVGALVHDDIAATHVVAAVATALAIVLSYFLAGTLGLQQSWRLAVPLSWIACGAFNLAALSTPDGLETLLTLGFVLVACGRWPWPRALALAMLAVLMVAARTDAILLLGFLMLAEWVLEPRHRPASVLIFFAALMTYLAIQQLSGNYGYVAVFNFQLVEDRAHPVVPNLVPNLHGYLVALARGLVKVLGRDLQAPLYAVALALLVFAGRRARAERAVRAGDATVQRALVLCAALSCYLVARFVLFPDPQARYVAGTYVLAGLLFARSIQPGKTRAA